MWWLVPDHHDALCFLAGKASSYWRDAESNQFLAKCYVVRSAEDAEVCLAEWLGISSPQGVPDWPIDTLPESIRDRLVSQIRKALSEDKLNAATLRTSSLSTHLRIPIAYALADYMRSRPDLLDRAWLDWFRQFLSDRTVQELERLRVPEDPGFAPEEGVSVLSWYRHAYLPWKRWASANRTDDNDHRAREIAGSFAIWYLRSLPKLLIGAPGQELLAWVRAGRLPGNTDFVTLLLVADGLAPDDGERLLHHIKSRVPRLRTAEVGAAFTQLPTITDFTKSAIVQRELTGRVVHELENQHATKVRDVSNLLSGAAPGDVVAWTLVEPDQTYHFDFDEAELDTNIDAELYEIAGHLQSIVESVPDHVRLRVMLTADHGRLVGSVARAVKVPHKLHAHSRAAWGPTQEEWQGAEPFRIDGNIAWLHPRAYGLPTDQSYAVVLNDQSFLTNDGRGGLVHAPHGGVYPEEVVVPWMTFLRDVLVADVAARVIGSGTAGREGTLSLTVANPNEFAVELSFLELTTGGQTSPLVVTIDKFCESMAGCEFQLTVPHWPHLDPSSPVTATLTLKLPGGEERHQRLSTELSSDTLYTGSSEILGDLL
jgi:hypothetical protein